MSVGDQPMEWPPTYARAHNNRTEPPQADHTHTHTPAHNNRTESYQADHTHIHLPEDVEELLLDRVKVGAGVEVLHVGHRQVHLVVRACAQ